MDLTLYLEDVVLLRDALRAYASMTSTLAEVEGVEYYTACNLKHEAEDANKLRDKLLDRLTQKLHPESKIVV